jgi:hypothetical protein
MGAHEVIQTRISFANDSYRVNEGIGTATITVTLDQVLPLTATVDYTTANSGLPFGSYAGRYWWRTTRECASLRLPVLHLTGVMPSLRNWK